MRRAPTHRWACLGPAALVTMATISLVLGLTGAGCSDRPVHPRRLVILDIDGMDPQLARRLRDEGRLPHLKALGAQGSFLNLGTTMPAQSPVAWAAFITGNDQSVHGIYDFVHRDPRRLSPYLSTSRTRPPWLTLPFFKWQLPLGGGSMELLREGTAFWEVLEQHGIPVTAVKIPDSFPPEAHWQSEVLSGMGTPDLLGTYGTFNLLTSDPAVATKRMSGGVVQRLTLDREGRALASLKGPPSPLRKAPTPMALPIEVVVGPQQQVALVRLGDEERLLRPGEWSEWVPVAFDPGLLSGNVHGMVRLYLRSLSPHVHLYMSPINLDPLHPAMPVSSPPDYATGLARRIGRYYTQGFPEDTKALSGGALTRDEFLAQADLVLQERLRMLDDALSRYRGGLLFFYVSSLDQTSHVFLRSLDPHASPELKRYAHVLPDLYERLDQVVGQVVKRVGPETTVLVMSDHGFSQYRHKVHLNRWLLERGYLALADPQHRTPGPLGHIDWTRTQAYALGLNQLFVNLKGREAHGAVPPGEREILVRRLARELRSWRDPNTGAPVVRRVLPPPEGGYLDRRPDLIVGYDRGYRSSDESAIGTIANRVIEPNHDVWAGDHCMDPAVVPAILVSSRRVAITDPTLMDFAPTILRYFDVPPPPPMPGRGLFTSQGADHEKAPDPS